MSRLARALLMPTQLITLSLWRHPSRPANLRLHIRPIFDVLPEVADVAAELLVGFEAEWDDGDEAKGEPLPALHRARGVVATVLALEREVLGALEGGGECF